MNDSHGKAKEQFFPETGDHLAIQNENRTLSYFLFICSIFHNKNIIYACIKYTCMNNIYIHIQTCHRIEI